MGSKVDLVEDWHRWFAWYPVLVGGGFVFWKWVERRRFEEWHYGSYGPVTDRYFFEYRRVGAGR